MVVSVLLCDRAREGRSTRNIRGILPSLSGGSHRRSGSSTMPSLTAALAAFDNPDHVAIVIHNYRWRLGLAEGETKYDDLEKRLAQGPIITVPTITLEGDANGAPHPDASTYSKKFSGKYAHRVIKGRHWPQRASRSAAGLCRRRASKWLALESRTAAGGLKPAGRIPVLPRRNRERIPITFRRGLNLALVMPGHQLSGKPPPLTEEKALHARELKRFVALPSQWRANRSRACAAKQPK